MIQLWSITSYFVLHQLALDRTN